MKILVLNCGSSSIKYKLFEMESKEVIAQGGIEKIGMKGSFLKLTLPDGQKVMLEGEILEHRAGIEYILGVLLSEKYGCIKTIDEIKAVGHRVVHGGERFNSSVLITDGKTTTVNTYYRVKKGDTLGEIARKNNVLVSQLRSWNNLKSTRIDINDQLIVGQKVVALPAEKEQESNQEAKQEDQHVGSNIISDYLKSQLNKTTEAEEIQIEEEIEKISDFVVDF
jgi:LysM repeat protein